MTLFAVLDVETSICPNCGKSDEGLSFCAIAEIGNLLSNDSMVSQFLCDACFQPFITRGQHTTVLTGGR